jgi:hypothetical protein
VIERPRWNLTLFKVHFGLLTLKGYTKGEHVLRFEAIVHNTKTLHTGRVLEKFPTILARLAGMVDRFTSMLDCVDVAFLPDAILDHLPTPSQIGATRTGGLDINKPRTRAALAAVLALASHPTGSPSPTTQPKSSPSPARARTTTPSGKPPTTCANCAANTSSSNPAGPAATTCPGRPPAPSRRCSPSGTRSSPPFSPASADPDRDDPRAHAPASTATTRTCAPGCAPSSTTSRSTRQHRQQLLDP